MFVKQVAWYELDLLQHVKREAYSYGTVTKKSQKQQQDGINSPDGLGFLSFKYTGSPGLRSNSSSDGNQEIDRFHVPVSESTDGLKMFNNCSTRLQHGESCSDIGTNLIGTLQSFKDQSSFLSLKKNMGGKLLEHAIVQCCNDEEEVVVVTLGTKSGISHSRALVRFKAWRDYLTASAQAAERFFDNESILGLDEAYDRFKKMYPKFDSTEEVDEIRNDEYGHLEETLKVCSDYCGFGLFSYLQ
ncbi:hypothetical protein SUGI_0804590 [Cryptomeria japonica]|nr:hypothetical protein SUGI_0804590 [Cryptomeria japonica]